MPQASANRTIVQVPITQGAAGANDLVAAPGVGLKIYVVSFFVILDAAGSITWNEGTGPTALYGAIPLATNGQVFFASDGSQPVLQTNTANSKLTLTSATGKAFGWIRYFIDI